MSRTNFITEELITQAKYKLLLLVVQFLVRILLLDLNLIN